MERGEWSAPDAQDGVVFNAEIEKVRLGSEGEVLADELYGRSGS